MIMRFVVLICFFLSTIGNTQNVKNSSEKSSDSTKQTSEFLKSIGRGYFPVKYFDVDLKYLVKYNQFEGFRTGLGGTTDNDFSEKYRLSGYFVYGFKDKRRKFNTTIGARISKATNTWLHVAYTDDLQETGSSKFLTDSRFFTFFEPRLLNIDLFHRHITSALSIEHQFSKRIISETKFSVSNINPTYAYQFASENRLFNDFEISKAQISVQWSPFDKTINTEKENKTKKGYPIFTAQYTQAFKGVFGSDFNFSKLDFRTYYKYTYKNSDFTDITLTAGIAGGDAPLTHLYHAYPNNITKETILQRFSVAGINSFETMYFNEFFSDKFSTLQIKHTFKRFKIIGKFKPQLVLVSKYALGDMNSIGNHRDISFNTLNHLYSESGFEINKLFLGFGLSFAYRYGGYHLPNFDDNIAFKFTFNLSL